MPKSSCSWSGAERTSIKLGLALSTTPALHSASNGPVAERFLRSYPWSKARIKVGALHGFPLRQALSRKVAKLPINASPAPVESTLFTLKAGTAPCRRYRLAGNIRTQREITRRMPLLSNWLAHFFASSRLRTGMPQIASASLSFGTK